MKCVHVVTTISSVVYNGCEYQMCYGLETRSVEIPSHTDTREIMYAKLFDLRDVVEHNR